AHLGARRVIAGAFEETVEVLVIPDFAIGAERGQSVRIGKAVMAADRVADDAVKARPRAVLIGRRIVVARLAAGYQARAGFGRGGLHARRDRGDARLFGRAGFAFGRRLWQRVTCATPLDGGIDFVGDEADAHDKDQGAENGPENLV